MIKQWMVGTALITAQFAFAAAAQGCQNVDTHLSPRQRELYTRLIESSLPQPFTGHVTLSRYMGEGDWGIVFSQPPDSERGAFFFRHVKGKYILVDTWGGVAGPDSAESIAAWAKRLSPTVPPTLADCFANKVKFRW